MEVLGNKDAVPGAQQFRFEKRPQELFQIHAVITEKSGNGHRGGGEHTQPAGRLFAQDRAQAQVDPDGKTHGQNGADELAGRQPEENRFLVLPHLFWNFDFDRLPSC